MLVLTLDQRGSRNGVDKIDGLLARLRANPASKRFVRDFERTAGDEVQGLLNHPDDAVDVVLEVVRAGDWWAGVGVGPVREPIPASVRASTGPAFINAREAVERAKNTPSRLAVVGPDPRTAAEAESLLALLSAVVQRRTGPGWEVVDLIRQGLPQKDIATDLKISPQAVSQRLRTALWQEERGARPLAARLLTQADEAGRASRGPASTSGRD
ncbi:hypothetical protein [Actinopolymorpha rutila]|uniref:SatD family (SatD) n=1 Tax=Actinopolymorpha rutila TaxID=446787 RepID=A0A852ZKT0_9ACTN|nr:hypothetical protein [Actinopolymorpha rutila]NYH93661.1 hypothetical protein [Actinopolymorpha rutila]